MYLSEAALQPHHAWAHATITQPVIYRGRKQEQLQRREHARAAANPAIYAKCRAGFHNPNTNARRGGSWTHRITDTLTRVLVWFKSKLAFQSEMEILKQESNLK